MGKIAVYFKDKMLMDVRSWVLSDLCYSIEKIIKEQNLELTEDVFELIDFWSITFGLVTFDVADYIHTKKDLITFTNLVKKGIDRFYQENPDLSQYNIDNLENFYKELIEAQKTFPK